MGPRPAERQNPNRMGAFTRTTLADGWTATRALAGPRASLRDLFAAGFELEWEHRRFFLWVPVLAGTGVLLYLGADHEPVASVAWALFAVAVGAAVLLRHSRAGLMAGVAAASVMGGLASADLRGRTVAAPVLDRTRVDRLVGWVEEVDPRRTGSRFVLRVEESGLEAAHRPARVRLTTRRDEPLAAGDRVALTARLLPPAQASLPDGYSFARDAYFMGLGAVGSVLGRVRPAPADASPGWGLRIAAAVDRARDTLAARVDGILGGDRGAIAAAMVTGKRDLLSADGRELIREAGIFHIITIAGVQMTLVAGLLFGGTRRLLALSPALALRYPVKKWAAAVALAGAVAYDVLTGSRIGTQRALFMTGVMLGAVLVDRRGFTMRNLALAALLVIAAEPEAVTGASFQLSFAAVAALVAVYEARERRRAAEPDAAPTPRGRLGRAVAHVRDLFVATVCATSATASFMAANFHELSPYVFVGNPLTLAVIELFAVPGALLGCALYPLGLDGPVWHWVGAGIGLVLWAARLLGSAPGATLHLPAFAPWALPFLALAVLSAVLWRSWAFRLSAVPLALTGLLGAAAGPRYDLVVAGAGDAVAVREADGRLALAGKGDAFAAEQWLAADGDGRDPGTVARAGRCDALACVARLAGGQTLSLVADARAFAEDCRRADVIVTRLYAPASCAAPLVIDKGSLAGTGALGLTLRNGGWVTHPARPPLEDRPWWPAPRVSAPRRAAPADPAPEGDGAGDASSPPEERGTEGG